MFWNFNSIFPFYFVPSVPKKLETFDWPQNEKLLFNYLFFSFDLNRKHFNLDFETKFSQI